jgi:hypothetical protein
MEGNLHTARPTDNPVSYVDYDLRLPDDCVISRKGQGPFGADSHPRRSSLNGKDQDLHQLMDAAGEYPVRQHEGDDDAAYEDDRREGDAGSVFRLNNMQKMDVNRIGRGQPRARQFFLFHCVTDAAQSQKDHRPNEQHPDNASYYNPIGHASFIAWKSPFSPCNELVRCG